MATVTTHGIFITELKIKAVNVPVRATQLTKITGGNYSRYFYGVRSSLRLALKKTQTLIDTNIRRRAWGYWNR